MGGEVMKTIVAVFTLMILNAILMLHSRDAAAEDAMDAYARLRNREFTDTFRPGTDKDAATLSSEASLDDLLTYAALHNPGLEAAFDQWKSSLESVVQVHALPEPRITYAYFLRNVETRVGPQRHRLEIAQMFPWFGTRDLRSDVNMADSDSRWEQFRAAKLKLDFDVRTAYYDLYLLERRIEVVRENQALLSSLEEVVRSRYTVGSASSSSLTRIQVELGKLEERLMSLEDNRRPLTVRLNAQLNRPANTPVEVAGTLDGIGLTLTDEDIVALVRERSPELRSLTALREKESASKALAGKAYYPDITVGLSYIETGEARMPGVADSGKDPLAAIVSLSLPIWRDKYRSQEEQAAVRERAAASQQDQRMNAIIADLQAAIFRYRDAERKISLYRDSLVPMADQSFAVTLQGFESGTESFLNLIDSERTLLEFQLSYEEAQVNRAVALAAIEQLTGGIESDNDMTEVIK